MDSTHVDGNPNNNGKMEDEFDNIRDDKVSVSETVISGGFINEEVYDTDKKQRSFRNYVSIKDENINDLNLVIPKTELKPDCTDDKMCINGTIISGEYIKQESCGMKDEQGTIQNHFSIKDENMDDLTVVDQETKLMTDCIDNKICIYETIISGGYIKQEPCDTSDESESIHNNIDMKGCEECGEKYDLYCLKCPMLIRIFNSNNLDKIDNTDRQTLPKNFIDICETPSSVGIVALRAIPKGVVFGPFEGLDSFIDKAISKWKLNNKELVLTKDPEEMNWMQYIRRADKNSHQNLVPFQYEDELYYRSECHIKVGDELLVCWGSDSKENEIQDIVDSYWAPHVCESLDDSYACTFCCVGYKSISHLEAHNSTCIEKRNKKDFCKEIVQCDMCKIYLDKKEYSDYHTDRCYKTDEKCVFNSRCRRNCERPVHNSDIPFSCTLCPYKATRTSDLKKHIAIHNGDKPFECALCSYKTTRKSNLKRHIATHNGVKPFMCSLCPYKTARKWNLKHHIATHGDTPFVCTLCPYETTRKADLKLHITIHNGDKPFACTHCPYKTMTKSELKQHIVIHNDDKPFACALCPYKTTRKFVLKQHLVIHNGDKPFACTHCPYKTITKSNLKKHIVIHNGDKPFECTLCPYKATRKSDLKVHFAIHNDDKPFACAFCGYKTKKKSNLKQHIAIHNEDKPFACTLCPYKAKTKSCLTKHIANHIDDKP